jgi:hypothetical protein
MVIYPQEFIDKCKEFYPSNKKLLKAIDEGQLKAVGVMLKESLLVDDLVKEILKTDNINDAHKVAKAMKDKCELYDDWQVVNSISTCSGTTEAEYKECCYNCEHFKTGKNIHDGTCKLHDKKVRHYKTSKCSDHREVELPQCHICGIFVRNLPLHVKSHNWTVDRYKEVFGYNRTARLTAEVTRKAQGVNSDISIANQYNTNPGNHNKGYKIRQQGMLNHGQIRTDKDAIKRAASVLPKVKGVRLNHRGTAFNSRMAIKGEIITKDFHVASIEHVKEAYDKAVAYRQELERMKGDKKCI